MWGFSSRKLILLKLCKNGGMYQNYPSALDLGIAKSFKDSHGPLQRPRMDSGRLPQVKQ